MNYALFRDYIKMRGGVVKASERLPIKPVMVRAILNETRTISVPVANAIHADTNGLISREELLPEVYGPVDDVVGEAPSNPTERAA